MAATLTNQGSSKKARGESRRAFFIGRNFDQTIFDGTLNVISAVPIDRVVIFSRKAVVNLSGKCTLLNLKPGKIYLGKSRDLGINRMIE